MGIVVNETKTLVVDRRDVQMIIVDIEEMRVLFHIESDEASLSIDFQLRRVRDG